MSEQLTVNQYPHVAVGVIVKKNDGTIFLGHCPKWENKWIVPGGHVEFGEPLEETVKREIKEELGVDVGSIRFITFQEQLPTPNSSGNSSRHFIFLNYSARIHDESLPITINDEYDSYCFTTPEAALSELDLNDSSREFINRYLQTRDSKS